jgi:hypothetical protein
MRRLTIAQAAQRLNHFARQISNGDEQVHLYPNGTNIPGDVLGVPQAADGEPVAVLISARRYAWLNEQAAKVPPAER